MLAQSRVSHNKFRHSVQKRSWATQVKTLCEIDPEFLQEVQSFAVLYALCDRLTTETLRKIPDLLA
jgi:hypothetical protein